MYFTFTLLIASLDCLIVNASTMSKEEIKRDLDEDECCYSAFMETDSATGLTDEQVKERLERCGYNESVEKRTPFPLVLLRKFFGPVEIILELLALYFFLVAPWIAQLAGEGPRQVPPSCP